MRIKHLGLLVTVLALCVRNLMAAPLGTAFTYQGRMTAGGNATTGLYDLTFKLYDAENGGSQEHRLPGQAVGGRLQQALEAQQGEQDARQAG